ncbi:hypothetical protein DL991_10085 [Amycolatopsis sp. WAC 01375]|uniref:hypothetical protein n=1 Tax=Amycolatopsis sp. WAC 01375 TaxID=2203194 RepID=UPI000F76D17D|nr:hypothetical protein [Amycolatopsis sp. WAC 01375]RSM80470.1 hypothetical protein DL991_10085 [Amycolatopsis sp. WAC 01375]
MTDPTTSPGHERLHAGLTTVRAALSRTVPDPGHLQQLVEARAVLRSAMDHLEDAHRDDFAAAHTALDQLGRLLRQHYPSACVLPFRDGTYRQECPVELAHLRVGLSPRIRVIASHCSICNQDPEDCAHLPGRAYDGQRCLSVITDAEIIDVALVGRPRLPDARITSWGIDLETLQTALGPTFSPGDQVLCGSCLSPCRGLNRQFENSTHG